MDDRHVYWSGWTTCSLSVGVLSTCPHVLIGLATSSCACSTCHEFSLFPLRAHHNRPVNTAPNSTLRHARTSAAKLRLDDVGHVDGFRHAPTLMPTVRPTASNATMNRLNNQHLLVLRVSASPAGSGRSACGGIPRSTAATCRGFLEPSFCGFCCSSPSM